MRRAVWDGAAIEWAMGDERGGGGGYVVFWTMLAIASAIELTYEEPRGYSWPAREGRQC